MGKKGKKTRADYEKDLAEIIKSSLSVEEVVEEYIYLTITTKYPNGNKRAIVVRYYSGTLPRLIRERDKIRFEIGYKEWLEK